MTETTVAAIEEDPTLARGPDRLRLAAVLGALMLSGFAAIVNQVTWQRALKVFLGGSEAISSMIVVLAFMAGLGVGSIWMGQRATRLRNPLLAFGLVELGLATVNFLIALILRSDISESVFSAQRLAISSGMPLRAAYALSAIVILIVPCFLMGVTMPVSSEACKRQLGATRTRLIAVLFFLNTGGAAAGTVASGFYLLPYCGQFLSLVTAAVCNLVAGSIVLSLARGVPAVRDDDAAAQPITELRLEDIVGGVLGFLALGYEMFLFRLTSLTSEPLPYTFAGTLCLFLVLWSIGVYASAATRERIGFSLSLTAALVLATLVVFRVDRFDAGIYGAFKYSYGYVYFLPCGLFGLLYGHMVSRSAKAWGRDVGLYYAVNCLGSCCGILFFTLVGYELPLDLNAILIGGGLLLLAAFFGSRQPGRGSAIRWGLARFVGVPLLLATLTLGLVQPYTSYYPSREWKVFWGRGGVVEIWNDKNLFWDGLWHSVLATGDDYVGSANWLLAVAPVVGHDEGPIREALVVGLGSGITAGVLARVDGVRNVDVYEINPRLLDVLAAYPEGTLDVRKDGRVKILWQDGRSGLALNPKKYDVITQQPLYLKQAGSSILLSREYMSLVRRRLQPNGVFCIYSNSYGNAAQALLVRETAATVFPYTESFGNGYLILAGNAPFGLSPDAIQRRLSRYPRLLEQVRLEEERKHRSFSETYDARRLQWNGGGYLITDDCPLVEYPAVAARLVAVH